MPPKLRCKPKRETTPEYEYRLKEWEALRPHKVDIYIGGNYITQLYYTEYILPYYIDTVYNACCYRDEQVYWLLIEDRDPSYRMKKYGVVYKLKDTNWITNLKYPAQSPDLNPIEGIWNIIKNRLYKKVYCTNKELKEAIQAE
jgi:hypothetical protein